MKIGAMARLLRPKQWTKNLLALAALIFTGRFLEWPAVAQAAAVFASLSLASSATYALNDLLDAERDRNHPKKRFRPVASGEVSRHQAAGLSLICAAGGLGIALALGMPTLAVVAGYLALQLAYNFLFKTQPPVDVFVLAIGFVLRAMAGATALGVAISGWLLFCTMALALLFGFSKRRSERLAMGEEAALTRPALAGYSGPALDALVVFSGGLAALSYGVYAIQSATALAHPGLILTAPFVLYGVARYLQMSFSTGEGQEPDVLIFTDRHLVWSLIGFFGTALLALGGLKLPFVE